MSGAITEPEWSDGFVTVYDTQGAAHQVPLRPDGAYLQALERSGAQRDARRPVGDLFDELTVVARDLAELERTFRHRRA